MPATILSPASASPSPAAHRDSGWPRPSPARARRAGRVRRAAANGWKKSPEHIRARTASSEMLRRKTTSIRWRCRFSASWEASTSSSTTHRLSVRRPGASRRHGVRRFGARARDRRPRSVPSHEGAARRARRIGTRRARRGCPERVERRSGECVSHLGRIRREQSSPPAPDPHLGCGALGTRGAFPVHRSGRHGHAAARARGSGCRSLDSEASRRRRARDARRHCGDLKSSSAQLCVDPTKHWTERRSVRMTAARLLDRRPSPGAATHPSRETRRRAAGRRPRRRERRGNIAGKPAGHSCPNRRDD